MNTYSLLLSGGPQTLGWTYVFTQPSDSDAKLFAEKALANDPCAGEAMNATLFREEGDSHYICHFAISTKTNITVRE